MIWFSFVVTADASPTVWEVPEFADPVFPGEPADDVEESHIVGGEQAPAGNDEVVALAFYDETIGAVTTFCSGTVIQDDWILTAAHCITESEGSGLQRVAAWGLDLVAGTPTEQIPWAEAIVSPVYDDQAFTGDIGLIRLQRPHPDPTWVVLRDETFGADQVGVNLEVFGYGVTTDGGNDGGILRTTFLPIESVDADNIRTFTPESNLCSGDSGGPAFVPGNGVREQVGVNAFVAPRICVGGSAGYTRVDVHVDWIVDLVPGVALDPSQLPVDEPEPGEDPQRGLLDFGVGERPDLPVVVGEGSGPGQGCATTPSLAPLGLLPLLTLLRRRNTHGRAASHKAETLLN